MIVERIKPNVAIVTDVTHDTQTPMMDKIKNGDIAAGKGPVLTYSPAVHNNLLKHIIKTNTISTTHLPKAPRSPRSPTSR